MRRILCCLCCCWFLLAAAGCADAVERTATDATIGLVWQPVISKDVPDLAARSALPPGINTVSPCWFVLTAEGDVKESSRDCRPDKDYVRRQHKQGCAVWALVSNDFDPNLTAALLTDPAARRRAVHRLLRLCSRYALDGLNLDFENINPADRDKLSDFVREICDALHADKRLVSVDVTIPGGSGNWSQCYDRKALAQYADYIALMTYDEYGRSSPVAGSVASLNWVERGLRLTLAEVPAHKLLLGIPLYTRLWEEEGGRVRKVRTLTMPEAAQLCHERQSGVRWLPEAGQYYCEYTDAGARCRLWQEDARSLALKAALVSRYDLAGAALWRLGFESQDAWDAVAESLRRVAAH